MRVPSSPWRSRGGLRTSSNSERIATSSNGTTRRGSTSLIIATSDSSHCIGVDSSRRTLDRETKRECSASEPRGASSETSNPRAQASAAFGQCRASATRSTPSAPCGSCVILAARLAPRAHAAGRKRCQPNRASDESHRSWRRSCARHLRGNRRARRRQARPGMGGERLGCHQPGMPHIPLLHGQSREALVSSKCARSATARYRARSCRSSRKADYSDAQIEAIAGCFAAASSGSR